MKIGQSAGKSWEYLSGVFLGDGCVTRQVYGPVLPDGTRKWLPTFRLNTIDQEFAEATKEALQQHTARPISIHVHPVSKSSKPNWSLRCGDREICARLVAETAAKQQLPEWVWTTDHEGRLAFIAGLMDSEGFVSQNAAGTWYMGYKSTDVWFADFVRVLNKAGIEIGKIGVEKPLKPGYRTPRRFTVKMRSWVSAGAYFNIRRKSDRVQNWVQAQLASEANTRNAA